MSASANYLDTINTLKWLSVAGLVTLLPFWSKPCQAQPITLDDPVWISVDTQAPDGGNELTDTYSLDLNCDGIVDLEVISYRYGFSCFGCEGTQLGYVSRSRNWCRVQGSLLYINSQPALPAFGSTVPLQSGTFSPYQPLSLWFGDSEDRMLVFCDGIDCVFWPFTYCEPPSGLLAPDAMPINLVFRFGENNEYVGYLTVRNVPIGWSFPGCPYPQPPAGRLVIDRVAWQPLTAGDVPILLPDSPANYVGAPDDCNSNGIPDPCDLAIFGGTSSDENSNFIPDECDNPECTADFDLDGNVGVPDIFAFLSAWFAQSSDSDIDGTPGIGVPDIFAFLSLWFAGCP